MINGIEYVLVSAAFASAENASKAFDSIEKYGGFVNKVDLDRGGIWDRDIIKISAYIPSANIIAFQKDKS